LVSQWDIQSGEQWGEEWDWPKVWQWGLQLGTTWVLLWGNWMGEQTVLSWDRMLGEQREKLLVSPSDTQLDEQWDGPSGWPLVLQ
jgi:hypothetical protein